MTLKINVSELVRIKDILVGTARRLLTSLTTFFKGLKTHPHIALDHFAKTSGNKAPPVEKRKVVKK